MQARSVVPWPTLNWDPDRAESGASPLHRGGRNCCGLQPTRAREAGRLDLARRAEVRGNRLAAGGLHFAVFQDSSLLRCRLDAPMQRAAAFMIAAFLVTSGLQRLQSNPGGSVQVSVPVLGRDEYGRDDYPRLLDLLLPVDRDLPQRIDYAMVLRFAPNWEPESQITIQAMHDGTVKAFLLTCVGGAGASANAQLARSGRKPIEELAKAIRVERKELVVQRSKVEQWHKSLREALQQSLTAIDKDIEQFRRNDERAVWLDGADFDLWYLEGEVETHWRAVDRHQGDHMPFSKWMIVVRQSILAQR